MNIDDVISIEDIYLKILHPEDIHDGYISSLNDPKINQFLVNVKTTLQTYDTVRIFINNNLNSSNTFFFGIWHKESKNKIIGTIKLHHSNIEKSDIGICLFDPKFWNKGIGTKAIKAVSDWALCKKISIKITAGIYLENKASVKSFTNAGYKLTEINSTKYFIDNNPAPVGFFEYSELLKLKIN